MSSYQKFSLSTFAKKLRDGDYANATGANRAIGKTQELSEDEKRKAKAMVARHFGVEEAPAKAAPKKKASKKAAKKVAKKAVKKVAKAAAKPAKKSKGRKAIAVDSAAPKKKVAKKASKKASKKAATKRAPRAKSAQDAEAAPVSEHQAIAEALVNKPPFLARAKHLPLSRVAPSMSSNDIVTIVGAIVNTIDAAIASMDRARNICPKADLDSGVQTAHNAMSKAITILDQNVLSPLVRNDGEGGGPPKAPSKPASKSNGKPATASTAPENNSSKRGKRGRAGSASDEASNLQGPPRDAKGKVIIDQDLLDDPTMSDEEREQMMYARATKAVTERQVSARSS